MRRNRRKHQKARDFLVAAIDSGQFDLTGRLPSMATLAKAAGVSVFTMWHAAEALRRDGRIAREPGRRLSLPRAQAKPAPVRVIPLPVRRSKSRTLQARISHDLHNGFFRHDKPLPSIKELSAHYGVYPATLRKALDALVEDRVLIHRANHFLPMPIFGPAIKPGSRIVLLGPGSNIGATITLGYWHQEYLRTMETECARANLSLDIVCFFHDDAGNVHFADGRTEEPVRIDKDDGALGYVYESTGRESFSDEILGMIAQRGRPVAVLDETGAWPTLSMLKRFPSIRLFRNTISDAPARHVARFLFDSGHRRMAFISPLHETEYSQQRLRGLEQAFSVTEDARLVPVTSLGHGDYIAQGAERIGFDRLWEYYLKLRSGKPYAYGYSVSNHLVKLRTVCGEARLFEDLERLLDRTLEMRDTTAWIAVNDECAHYALDYLTRRGVKVPGEMSIIGFDDHPIALQNGITSFAFNQTATMLDMLRYITTPRLFPARKPIVEIEGHVVPRRTTGRARVKPLQVRNAL